MIKQTLKYIQITLTAVTLLLTAGACTDELSHLGGDDTDLVYGIPLKVIVPTSTSGMSVVTRADMASGRDSEINSIWIAFFDQSGQIQEHYLLTRSETSANDVAPFKNLEVNVHSGRYYVAAVANPVGNYGVSPSTSTAVELDALLEDVKTFNDYKNIALIQDAGIITTPVGNLVMQGVFVPNTADHTDAETPDGVEKLANSLVTISREGPSSEQGTVTLPGRLHFRRLISQVKFSFGYDATNIKDFEPLSIQVSNVPALSWIAERGSSSPATVNAGDLLTAHTEGGSYADNYNEAPVISGAQFGYDGTRRTIDFYQLENRRTGRASTYTDRELETKTASGLNTGIYEALTHYSDGTVAPEANQMATYVTLTARMTMINPGSMPQGGAAVSRTVVARYTIHLGCVDGYGDFNNNRNNKYTYKVNIKDIDKIELEAKRLDGTYENGAEGVVTVISDAVLEADAHFSVFNVYLPDEEMKDFKWNVRAYTSLNNYIDITEANYASYPEKYWKWVEFRATTGRGVIADYKPASSGTTYDLNQMLNLTATQKSASGWYTVFLNEYVYEDGTDPGLLTPNWKSYVNLPDRTVWLKVQEERSSDGESIIFGSKYAISQHSIQTYYSTSPTSGLTSAMGMEHIDNNYTEGLIDARNNNYTFSKDRTDGRYMNWEVFESKFQNWNTLLTSTPATDASLTPTGTVKYLSGYYNFYNACLNRNRDLDGDGTIDLSEMRWFVPTDAQLVRLVMGAEAFDTPLFDFSSYTPGTTFKAPDGTGNYHYASLNNSKLWAEEGVSTGSIHAGERASHIRCVRYLGVDQGTVSNNPGQQAFEAKAGNIIEFYFTDATYRGFTATPLSSHDVSSDYNRPFRKIQYDTSDRNVSSLYYNYTRIKTTTAWFNYIDSNNPCSALNVNGQSGWRLPNQIELAALMYCGVLDKATTTYTLSCTKSFFLMGGVHKVMGANMGDHLTVIGNDEIYNSSYRCVKDVR